MLGSLGISDKMPPKKTESTTIDPLPDLNQISLHNRPTTINQPESDTLFTFSHEISRRGPHCVSGQNKWTRIAPLPSPLAYYGTAVLPPLLYVIGGRSDEVDPRTGEVDNPEAVATVAFGRLSI